MYIFFTLLVLSHSTNELLIRHNSYLLFLSKDKLLDVISVDKNVYLCFLCKILYCNELISTKSKDKMM